MEVWVSGKREDEEKFGLTMVEGKMDSAPRALATSRRTVQGARVGVACPGFLSESDFNRNSSDVCG